MAEPNHRTEAFLKLYAETGSTFETVKALAPQFLSVRAKSTKDFPGWDQINIKECTDHFGLLQSIQKEGVPMNGIAPEEEFNWAELDGDWTICWSDDGEYWVKEV